jgi:hypothetical protein
MKLKGCCLALVALIVSGCASAPTAQQTAVADYGNPMTADQCQSLVESALSYGLKDPGSAQFRHGAPCTKGWMSSVPVLGMKAAFGYYQEGQINGKNSYGAYVGFRPYRVLMRDGRVVRQCIADTDGICVPSGEK